MAQTFELPIKNIKHSSVTLRDIDRGIVEDLANSIRANGLLQPILVRPNGSSYEVIFGHHRLEACQLLGWATIDAIVRDISSDESFLTQVVENLQRNLEINPVNEANGYVALVDKGWTVDEIAKRIGKSDSYVSDRIGIVRRLHPKIARKFRANTRNGCLTASHLELLARIKSGDQQLKLSHLVEKKKLSVRKLEQLLSERQTFTAVIEENGDTLQLRLPQEVTTQTNITAGCTVNITIKSRRQIIIEASEITSSYNSIRSSGDMICPTAPVPRTEPENTKIVQPYCQTTRYRENYSSVAVMNDNSENTNP